MPRMRNDVVAMTMTVTWRRGMATRQQREWRRQRNHIRRDISSLLTTDAYY